MTARPSELSAHRPSCHCARGGSLSTSTSASLSLAVWQRRLKAVAFFRRLTCITRVIVPLVVSCRTHSLRSSAGRGPPPCQAADRSCAMGESCQFLSFTVHCLVYDLAGRPILPRVRLRELRHWADWSRPPLFLHPCWVGGKPRHSLPLAASPYGIEQPPLARPGTPPPPPS